MTYLLTRLAYSLEIPLHGQKCLGFRALDETKKVGGGEQKMPRNEMMICLLQA